MIWYWRSPDWGLVWLDTGGCLSGAFAEDRVRTTCLHRYPGMSGNPQVCVKIIYLQVCVEIWRILPWKLDSLHGDGCKGFVPLCVELLYTDVMAAHLAVPEHPWHQKILAFSIKQQQIQLALNIRLWWCRGVGSAGGQGRQHGAADLSAGLGHAALAWVAPSKLQGGSRNTYSFLRLPSCRCTACLQTSALDAGNMCIPNLALPTQAQRVASKCPCHVGESRTVSASCLQIWQPLQGLLFHSWWGSQSSSGGKQKGGGGKQGCHMGIWILNMCTDSSRYLLASRNVVLLVSWGKRGPMSELEAEPGTIMESRRWTSVNQRHTCLFTVQSAVGKLPQQAHKHIYRDFTARFVRTNKAITQHLRLGALYSMDSYPESL